MFWDGVIYQVKMASPGVLVEWESIVAGEVARILHAARARVEAENSLVAVRYLVERCVPDFPHEVTEENKAELLRQISLYHSRRSYYLALEQKQAQEWMRDHAETK